MLPLLTKLLLPLLPRPMLRLFAALKQQRRLQVQVPRTLSLCLLRVIRRREERSTEKLTALASTKECIPITIKKTSLQLLQ
jgi:hypothetical protein